MLLLARFSFYFAFWLPRVATPCSASSSTLYCRCARGRGVPAGRNGGKSGGGKKKRKRGQEVFGCGVESSRAFSLPTPASFPHPTHRHPPTLHPHTRPQRPCLAGSWPQGRQGVRNQAPVALTVNSTAALHITHHTTLDHVQEPQGKGKEQVRPSSSSSTTIHSSPKGRRRPGGVRGGNEGGRGRAAATAEWGKRRGRRQGPSRDRSRGGRGGGGGEQQERGCQRHKSSRRGGGQCPCTILKPAPQRLLHPRQCGGSPRSPPPPPSRLLPLLPPPPPPPLLLLLLNTLFPPTTPKPNKTILLPPLLPLPQETAAAQTRQTTHPRSHPLDARRPPPPPPRPHTRQSLQHHLLHPLLLPPRQAPFPPHPSLGLPNPPTHPPSSHQSFPFSSSSSFLPNLQAHTHLTTREWWVEGHPRFPCGSRRNGVGRTRSSPQGRPRHCPRVPKTTRRQEALGGGPSNLGKLTHPPTHPHTHTSTPPHRPRHPKTTRRQTALGGGPPNLGNLTHPPTHPPTQVPFHPPIQTTYPSIHPPTHPSTPISTHTPGVRGTERGQGGWVGGCFGRDSG